MNNDDLLQNLVDRVAKLESIVLANQDEFVSMQNIANFKLNERAFADKYIKGKAPEVRFAMIVAYLSKGDGTHEVTIDDIKSTWGRMTSIIKSFNPKYSTVAKTKGYVDSPRKSIYVLSSEWKETFKEDDKI